ncbi:MAG: nucleotide exchange factor GrpE [Beggiatoa sp. IS2]|nr:MAG: nucleotide exchange factor GrpE [Beggiatoa sp. IS2]
MPPEETLETLATFSIAKLTQQLAEMTQKAEIYKDSLLRQQAEIENLRKRQERELDNTRKYAVERFANELLLVKDSLELGIEAAVKPETPLDVIREGMNLTLKILVDLLAKFGIVEINPLNEKFNPQWHEAMTVQSVPNVEEGTVLYVPQKGYKLHDRLLRPARVIVAKAVESAEKPLENEG